MSGIRFMFLRDHQCQPVGCMAIQVDQDSVRFGMSVLNPKDRFDRTLARRIAQGRLEVSPIQIVGPSQMKEYQGELNMHLISATVMDFLANYKVAPTRARKAAGLWLDQNSSSLY